MFEQFLEGAGGGGCQKLKTSLEVHTFFLSVPTNWTYLVKGIKQVITPK